MLNDRGVVVLTLFVFAVTAFIAFFSDQLKPNYLCDVTKIDQCARTGGLQR